MVERAKGLLWSGEESSFLDQKTESEVQNWTATPFLSLSIQPKIWMHRSDASCFSLLMNADCSHSVMATSPGKKLSEYLTFNALCLHILFSTK